MDFKKYIDGALCKAEQGDKIEYLTLKGRASSNILTNAANIPAGGYHYEADITKFWDEFKKLKKEVDYPLSFNTLMLRVLAEGLKAAPRLNSHMVYKHDASCGHLVVKKHIDVAVPIFMDDGSTFPVKICRLEERSLKGIYEEMERLTKMLEKTDVDRVLLDLSAQRMIGYALKGKFVTVAKHLYHAYVGQYKITKPSEIFKHADRNPENSLQPYELNEATVCLSNLGSISRDFNGNVTYAPLLYPQVFLMALGAVTDKDYAFKNEKGEVDIATKKVLPINVMFDHRIGAFGDVVPFIRKVNEIFQNPEIIREW